MPGSGCFGQREIRPCQSADVAGRTPFDHLHAQAAECAIQDQSLQASSGPEVDNSCTGLCQGTRRHHDEKARVVCRPKAKSIRSAFPAGKQAKTKPQEERQRCPERRRKQPPRPRGGLELKDDMGRASFEGQESNPLDASISLSRWMACLPRWILKSRTKFAFCLSRCFAAMHRSQESITALFPLPLESLDSFVGSGPKLSFRRWFGLCKRRTVNVWILVLNFMYLGRWPSVDELRRCPNVLQQKTFERLRTLIDVCGDAQALSSMCPGRSGPELGATLWQLEVFCSICPDLKEGYLEADRVKFQDDKTLLPPDQYPGLQPYKSLDASRLKLVGEGRWPMEKFMEGCLWLPFHGAILDIPNFAAEKKDENSKLARLWDTRGFLALFPEPCRPGFFSRVFNAFKNDEVDRQIGDRRLVNQAEFHLDGPSRFLPQGSHLTLLKVPRFSHVIRGSVTDRRDFYHQAQVTRERARSNMLPFQYAQDDFEGSNALQCWRDQLGAKKTRKSREAQGDHLREVAGPKPRAPKVDRNQHEVGLYPAFASLFQGDHLGVEYALQSHGTLLCQGGLLDASTRIQGNSLFPLRDRWDALVIDDYFALRAERISTPAQKTFAFEALANARSLYEAERLLGSDEKDVIASTTLKAAGAEINSSVENARRGFVPVGALIAKRIALSMLSLRASCLPAVTGKLVARLTGNWVSVLQFRKVLSCLFDEAFRFGAGIAMQKSDAFHLTRSVAQEFVLLASVAPMLATNIAAEYLPEVFATDASIRKGAITKAKADLTTCECLWLDADKKGCYTHLQNPFRAILKQVAEADSDHEEAAPLGFDGLPEHPRKSPLLYFDFVEICGGAGKVADAMASFGHVVAPVLGISESPHYDLGSLDLLNWVFHMLEEDRISSFLIAPPCTTFSPAAHPACRSYMQPLGFQRTDPKTLHGNLLAFRSLLLLRKAKQCKKPGALEQSRLSKMAWLSFWRSLLDLGFEEAVIASCRFGSIHRKEFRLLCHLLDCEFLDCHCTGGHSHVRIEGKFTKPSAIYEDGVALHLAKGFHNALLRCQKDESLNPEVDGLEDALTNDFVATANWEVARAWSWKSQGHINVLELASSSSLVDELSRHEASKRFTGLVDSAVSRGALSKGRSASRALQPGLKRTGACCLASDLYPAWLFCPTRLNVADDPTRDVVLRPPLPNSIIKSLGEHDFRLCRRDSDVLQPTGFAWPFSWYWFNPQMHLLIALGPLPLAQPLDFCLMGFCHLDFRPNGFRPPCPLLMTWVFVCGGSGSFRASLDFLRFGFSSAFSCLLGLATPKLKDLKPKTNATVAS